MRAFMLILLLLLVHSLPPTLPVARAAQAPNRLFLPLVTTPVPVTVLSTYVSGARYGGLVAQGELRNTSAEPVYDVALKLTAYNRQGTAVYSTTNVVRMRALFPSEVGAFSFGFFYERFLADGAIVRITVIGWKTSIAEQLVPLEVLSYDVEVDYNFNGMELEIDLRNPTTVAVQSFRAMAWSFPQAGEVVPFTFEEALPPGGVTTITMYIPSSTRVAGIGIQAQGVP